MSFPFDRAFYRVSYPPQAAPRFRAGELAHRVVDFSEGGFRYVPTDGVIPAPGDAVAGVIDFREDESVAVEGRVVRIQAGEVAVSCPAGMIPLRIVLREQRWLLVHFPFREPARPS